MRDNRIGMRGQKRDNDETTDNCVVMKGQQIGNEAKTDRDNGGGMRGKQSRNEGKLRENKVTAGGNEETVDWK